MWFDWFWTGKWDRKKNYVDFDCFHAFWFVYFRYLLLFNLLFVFTTLVILSGVYAHKYIYIRFIRGTFDVHSRRTSSLEIISSVLIEITVHILSLYHVMSMTAGINFRWEWCGMHMYIPTYTCTYRDWKLIKKKEKHMNAMEVVSITCQPVNLSACMDCFRLSIEIHRLHMLTFSIYVIRMYAYVRRKWLTKKKEKESAS